MDPEATLFVVNPKAQGGMIEKRWGRFKKGKRLEGIREIHPLSLDELSNDVSEGIKGGVRDVVAVGGDGTVHQVLNSLFHGGGLPVSEDITLSTIPVGTGCDFAKSLNIPGDIEGAYGLLENGRVQRVDAGVIRFRKRGGGEGERYFINVGGFGANGEVVDRVNRSSKWAGGFLTFLSATLATLLKYRSKRAVIRVDGETVAEDPVNTLFVANGRFCGAGMLVAPRADLQDGLFDIVIVRDLSPLNSLFNIPKLYDGRILSHPGIDYHRGELVEASPCEEGDYMVESDGEQPGLLPAEFKILKGVIKVRTGKQSLTLKE